MNFGYDTSSFVVHDRALGIDFPEKEVMTMKWFVVGCVVMILSAVISIGGQLMGILPHLARGVGIVMVVGGFVTQLWGMFSIRAHLERDVRDRQIAHRALLEEVKTLPPGEAIRRLLSN